MDRGFKIAQLSHAARSRLTPADWIVWYSLDKIWDHTEEQGVCAPKIT